MSDLIEGRITPMVAQATCRAGNAMLKVVEMQYRYGAMASNANESRALSLTK